MKWILIAYIAGSYAGVPITQEFDSRDACMGAIEQIDRLHSKNPGELTKAKRDRRADSWATCLPGGI